MRMLAVFEKGERLRHIGHLDILRAMQRALRRSGLPVSYSNGFSPHILLTFASALGVGAAGLRELMDVTLEEDVTPEDFLQAMNAALPPEMQVISARVLPERTPALMSLVAAAEYDIRLSPGPAAEAMLADVPAFLQETEIPAQRKTKSGVKDINLRPWIFHLEAADGHLLGMLALSDTENCKPAMLVEALAAHAGVDAPRFLAVRRQLMGRREDGTLMPLEETGL